MNWRDLDPSFSHHNWSSQTNITCMSHCNLINYKMLASCLICGHDAYPSCCRPSPGDQELTETDVKPGFRQVQNTYISCNWSHASPSLKFASQHENSLGIIHAFVVSEKQDQKSEYTPGKLIQCLPAWFWIRKKKHKLSNAALGHNWPGFVDILFLVRETNDIELIASQWVKILLR